MTVALKSPTSALCVRTVSPPHPHPTPCRNHLQEPSRKYTHAGCGAEVHTRGAMETDGSDVI